MRGRRAVRLMIVAGAFVLLFTGCSGPPGNEPTQVVPLVVPPRATPTPLATEASGNGSFYKPPGWNGVSDLDCGDFDTRANAQSFFIGTRGSITNDPYGLDGDHDAIACETLP